MWGNVMNNFLGLDPSLNSTGCVVVDENKNVVHNEAITSNIKDDIYTRVQHITDRIIDVANEFHPIRAAIENLSFASRGRGMFQLAGLHFLICISLKSANIDFIEVAPTSLKKFVTNSGRARKEMMLLQIYKKYGIEFNTSDEADAYGLALMSLSDFLKCEKQK